MSLGICVGPENQAREMQTQLDHAEEAVQAVGQLLRETREEKGLTVQQVSIETRIRQVYINAIEAGEVKSLPGEIYKIGFIKTYASFLELDPIEILRRLGLGPDTPVNYANSPYAIPMAYQRQPNKKILYLSILGAFAFSVFAYVTHNTTHEIDSYTTVFEKEKTVVSSDLESPPTEMVPELESLIEPVEPELIKQTDLKAVQAAAEIRISPLTVPLELQEKKAVSTSSSPLNKVITITAIKDSWVQIVDSSDKTVYVRLMHAGDRYVVPQRGDYTLNTGNAGGLKITCNELEAKTLGADGQVIRGINLNESGLSAYFAADTSPPIIEDNDPLENNSNLEDNSRAS